MPISRSVRGISLPVWASPPEALSAHQRKVLWLLTLASMSYAFVNTLFTQTVAFAADEFGISTSTQGFAAAVVRWGIIISFPFVVLADRHGRRRIVILMAWLAPSVSALGALSPSFPFLVATQTVGRPLGLTLEIRLPLADLGVHAWRYIYVIALIWLVVAAVLTRHLPETQRFIDREGHQVRNDRAQVSRLRLIASVAFLANIFIASASIFQNRYLKDIRGYSALVIAVFTTLTSAPASLGLVLGGRIADLKGRRLLAASMIPIGSALVALSFVFGGFAMWIAAIVGGFAFGLSYPAMSVYRGELFPTGRRSTAGAIITASSLLGGSIGLIAAGRLVDTSMSYGAVMCLLSLAPCIAAILVWVRYPETAHQELEVINPLDVVVD
ncbi:MAG: MFS transporter [Actinobacteria bacterium]|nr:MFS transporter [Actinomycetota bacterium]